MLGIKALLCTGGKSTGLGRYMGLREGQVVQINGTWAIVEAITGPNIRLAAYDGGRRKQFFSQGEPPIRIPSNEQVWDVLRQINQAYTTREASPATALVKGLEDSFLETVQRYQWPQGYELNIFDKKRPLHPKLRAIALRALAGNAEGKALINLLPSLFLTSTKKVTKESAEPPPTSIGQNPEIAILIGNELADPFIRHITLDSSVQATVKVAQSSAFLSLHKALAKGDKPAIPPDVSSLISEYSMLWKRSGEPFFGLGLCLLSLFERQCGDETPRKKRKNLPQAPFHLLLFDNRFSRIIEGLSDRDRITVLGSCIRKLPTAKRRTLLWLRNFIHVIDTIEELKLGKFTPAFQTALVAAARDPQLPALRILRLLSQAAESTKFSLLSEVSRFLANREDQLPSVLAELLADIPAAKFLQEILGLDTKYPKGRLVFSYTQSLGWDGLIQAAQIELRHVAEQFDAARFSALLDLWHEMRPDNPSESGRFGERIAELAAQNARQWLSQLRPAQRGLYWELIGCSSLAVVKRTSLQDFQGLVSLGWAGGGDQKDVVLHLLIAGFEQYKPGDYLPFLADSGNLPIVALQASDDGISSHLWKSFFQNWHASFSGIIKQELSLVLAQAASQQKQFEANCRAYVQKILRQLPGTTSSDGDAFYHFNKTLCEIRIPESLPALKKVAELQSSWANWDDRIDSARAASWVGRFQSFYTETRDPAVFPELMAQQYIAHIVNSDLARLERTLASAEHFVGEPESLLRLRKGLEECGLLAIEAPIGRLIDANDLDMRRHAISALASKVSRLVVKTSGLQTRNMVVLERAELEPYE